MVETLDLQHFNFSSRSYLNFIQEPTKVFKICFCQNHSRILPQKTKKFLKINILKKSGEHIDTMDHLEFTVSRAVILLFLNSQKRYSSSVITKTLRAFVL